MGADKIDTPPCGRTVLATARSLGDMGLQRGGSSKEA
jgi:hypothetical protein